MVALPQHDNETIYMTEAEYLAFEEKSDIKHEYVNGRVQAMTGGSLRHNVISSNTNTTLNNQLVDKDCLVPSNDTRVKVDSKKVSYRYPDITIVCGEPIFFKDRVDTIMNPIVLIEVLSPSTEIDDRNDKLEEYLRLETLQEYLLISQVEAKIEQYLRQDDDQWSFRMVRGEDEGIRLPSIDCDLRIEDVYRKVNLDSDEDIG